EIVMIDAQPRDQAEPVSGEMHFILREQRRAGRVGDREVAYRERVRRHDRRLLAGYGIALVTIAQFLRARPRHVETPGQIVAHVAGIERLARDRLDAGDALLEIESAEALQRIDRAVVRRR